MLANCCSTGHNEGTTTSGTWKQTPHPFYGWGTAGRLETTALAVEALAKLESLGNDPALAEQVNRGSSISADAQGPPTLAGIPRKLPRMLSRP